MQLRRWGTATMYWLPRPPTRELTVGAAETCGLRLDDRSGRVSRLHARLVRRQTRWLLRDEGSKNGVWIDGGRRGELMLTPGLEIRIGGVTLIAESPLLNALRSFLARLLGWKNERTVMVDLALRTVRMAATRRTALMLCGDGDLVPIARAIHRHVRNSHRPFIVCDPRRQAGKETVRSAENHAVGMEALAAAAGGSLCVRSRRLPPDFAQVVERLRDPTSQVQLIVCAEAPKECERCRVTPLVIPPLADRQDEIDRIIHEYAHDAMVELATPRYVFQAADHDWVREHAASSLPEIEKATLRLVALRASRNLSHAATQLGMAPVSLSRWIGRREMPMEIVT
ncbi:MAG TPA: FHA domain-containing protein [Kofleriaceae bacterium]